METKALPTTEVRKAKWEAVQGQQLTMQWEGRLDLEAVIMTLPSTLEFAKSLGVSP